MSPRPLFDAPFADAPGPLRGWAPLGTLTHAPGRLLACAAAVPQRAHGRCRVAGARGHFAICARACGRIFNFLEGAPAPEEVLSQFKAASELKWGNVGVQTGADPPAHTHNGVVNKHYRNWQVNQPLFDGRAQWAKADSGLTDKMLKELYSCPMFTDLMISNGYLDRNNESQWYDRVPPSRLDMF